MPTLLSDQQLLLVARRHQDTVIRVSDGLEARIGVLWDQLGGITDVAQARFSEAAAEVVVRTQRWTIGAAESYIRTYVQRATGEPTTGARIDIDEVLAGLRGGVQPLDVYARPTITARKALSDGKAFADAMRIARTRATSTSGMDVALASRAGTSEAMGAQSRVVGHRRLPDGNACTYCLIAATQRYGAGQLQPLHTNCHCDVIPIIGTTDPGRIIDRQAHARLKASGAIDQQTAVNRRIRANRLKDIAVHEHGELGPVLTKAGDHFTGPAGVAH